MLETMAEETRCLLERRPCSLYELRIKIAAHAHMAGVPPDNAASDGEVFMAIHLECIHRALDMEITPDQYLEVVLDLAVYVAVTGKHYVAGMVVDRLDHEDFLD